MEVSKTGGKTMSRKSPDRFVLIGESGFVNSCIPYTINIARDMVGVYKKSGRIYQICELVPVKGKGRKA